MLLLPVFSLAIYFGITAVYGSMEYNYGEQINKCGWTLALVYRYCTTCCREDTMTSGTSGDFRLADRDHVLFVVGNVVPIAKLKTIFCRIQQNVFYTKPTTKLGPRRIYAEFLEAL